MRRLLLALPLLAAACQGPLEPHERPGTWQASGVNDANLRAMIADPAHLDRGAAPASASRGEPAARAAIRAATVPAAQRLPAGGPPSAATNRGGGAPAPGAP